MFIVPQKKGSNGQIYRAGNQPEIKREMLMNVGNGTCFKYNYCIHCTCHIIQNLYKVCKYPVM